MSSHFYAPPTAAEIYRYRYQHGVNLNSVFVLEEWVDPHMFGRGITGYREIDAVQASVSMYGVEKTREIWEAHWATAITDDDLRWLTTVAHCNSIRLPIGYYTLGPDFCHNTPFQPKVAEVYINAWKAVKKICQMCHNHGVGVLLDMDTLPGGTQSETHLFRVVGTAGSKADSPNMDLWQISSYQELATSCLIFVAEELGKCPEFGSVVGLQIFDGHIADSTQLFDRYETVLGRISAVNPSLPIYIQEPQSMESTITFATDWNKVSSSLEQPRCPVIVETECVYIHVSVEVPDPFGALTKSVKATFPTKARGDWWKPWVCQDMGAVAIYVGEYSCDYVGQLVTHPKQEEEVEDLPMNSLEVHLGRVQTLQWERSASGAAFGTWKTGRTKTSAWDFARQIEHGSIPPPKYMLTTAEDMYRLLRDVDKRRPVALAKAIVDHAAHCRKRNWPEPECPRYADGFEIGWTDTRAFFAARYEAIVSNSGIAQIERPLDSGRYGTDVIGCDKIGAGMLDLWITKRYLDECRAGKAPSDMMWHWEMGFRFAVEKFSRSVAVLVPDEWPVEVRPAEASTAEELTPEAPTTEAPAAE